MYEVTEHLPLQMPRDRIALVSQVRSTLLTASLRALQLRGDLDRYFTLLPPERHATMKEMVAATWVPLPVADVHYRACNQLGYGPKEFLEMGRDVGHRIHGSVLSTLVMAAKGAGVTPWTAFSHFGRLWERIFVGGGITVRKIAPKEAHVEVVALPLVGIPYYHSAQRALFLGILDLFCTKAYAFDLPRTTSATGTTYRMAWA
jgi:hypothetical protein